MGSVAHAGHLESKASYSPPGDKKGQRQSIDSEGLESQKKMIIQTTGNVLHSQRA